MDSFLNNADLFSIGIVSAAIGILGFVVFLNNRRSITNKTFLFFSLATIVYGTFNYISYQVSSPTQILWLLRLTIFAAVWHAFSFFQLFFIFPKEKINFPPHYRHGLFPLVILTSLLTLTPAVFSHIEKVALTGQVTNPVRGPGIFLFGALVVFLVASGIYLLLKKVIRTSGEEKKQLKLILTGSLITFSLILTFNFVLPVFFNQLGFIPLAPIFIFPLIAFTGYAIYKHAFLDTKIIATEVLAFLLTASTLFEVILAKGPLETIFRGTIFVILLVFSILLIRSVQKEVRQREKLEVLTKELETANAALRKLDETKSEFISVASHQLRAPLTIIKGYVSLILEGTVKPGTQTETDSLHKVATATEQMIKLVNDFLNLSRIEAGKIKYEFIEHDFAKIVGEVVAEFQTNAAKKKLELVLQNDAPNLPAFVFDADKVREMVVNLTDNAIKYSNIGAGKIVLDLKLIGDGPAKIRLSVRDQGIGIKPEDLKKLFTKFVRTEEAKKFDITGTGLGLYFLKRVAEDHGGTVGVESAGVGKGSTFFVELPVQQK